MGVRKKIFKGENYGEMSKAEEKDRFLHGAKAWFKLWWSLVECENTHSLFDFYF